MNNSNPFIPQGSLLDQKNKSRARMRLAVFSIITISTIALVGLLIQGCRKPPEPESPAPETNNVVTPPLETTNAPETAPPPTNPPTPPPVVEQAPPPPPPAGEEYTVAKGDSFYSIGKKFGVTMKAIQDANPGVDSKKLKVGQKLHVPAGAPAATTPAAAPGAAEMGAGAEQTYAVKSGDSLTKIAKEFATTVKAIRAANSLTTDKIKVGQKLKIPAKASAPAPAPVEPAPPTTAPAPAPAPAAAPSAPPAR